MIFYIGDISSADAEVLKELAEQSSSILEFGCGASTQVLAKYARYDAVSTCIETSQEWIDRTKYNIKLLGITPCTIFYQSNDFTDLSEFSFPFSPNRVPYDFIFNDGVLSLRKEFAFKAWKLLKIGGILAFHDTRTTEVVKIISDFIEHHSPEIESVFINVNHSNITVIKKKTAEFYCDWNVDEKKEPWESGYAEVDLEKLKLKMQKHKDD